MTSIDPAPRIRGALISLLTQWHEGASKPEPGTDLLLPGASAALPDLFYMFMLYVQEAEAEDGRSELDAISAFTQMFVAYAKAAEERHGGDFREFLRRQALAPFPAD